MRVAFCICTMASIFSWLLPLFLAHFFRIFALLFLVHLPLSGHLNFGLPLTFLSSRIILIHVECSINLHGIWFLKQLLYRIKIYHIWYDNSKGKVTVSSQIIIMLPSLCILFIYILINDTLNELHQKIKLLYVESQEIPRNRKIISWE